MVTARDNGYMKRPRHVAASLFANPRTEKPRRVRHYTPQLRVRLLYKTCFCGRMLPLLLFILQHAMVSTLRTQHLSRKQSVRSLQAADTPSSSDTPTPLPTNVVPTSPTTSGPTLTPYPTEMQTTLVPTPSPTPFSFDQQRYSESFEVRNNTFFSDEDKAAFEELFESYTQDFAPTNETDRVSTDCVFLGQRFAYTETNSSSSVFECIIDYSMDYASPTVNVTGYTSLFIAYVNENLDLVTSDLQAIGLDITDTMETQFVQVETTGPTATTPPSITSPTITPYPTTAPPTNPTTAPTTLTFPPTPGPFDPAEMEASTRVTLPIIVPITVLAGMAVLIGIVFITRKRRMQHLARTKRRRSRYTANNQNGGGDNNVNHMGKHNPSSVASIPGMAVYGRNGSMISSRDNVSLVSDGESSDSIGSDKFSDDEAKNLQDEFDQYKDQNLEELRANVEGNLSGFEGIMSAAVTKVLMGDEDADMDTSDLMWGCQGTPTGAEVEASALVEVSDWLKRNDSAPVDRRRGFMQDMLNKMVASVRYGVIEAEDASRTIHESAALLGLQVANDLPMTTVIISGMRKAVEASEIINALSEFGDIEKAAVASGKRGFGIVRFRHPKSVERAMRRYRNAEIVIEDVAIQMKVLMPSGEVLSRA
ncbi:hypothetical protein MPSEU_000476000 [Mayamaea pseudoterrestris]|nr:hypothetical protein MPSEU_000476000 [Mayamaea pseudoterrestris]